MPSDLSGGMIKRAALARALALEPQLLFLDEPTAGLDPDLSDAFVALIQTLHRELKLTVVMVTHDLDTLFALSSRIAVLAEKHVLAVGPSRDVLRVEHPFIKQFFLGGAASGHSKCWKSAIARKGPERSDMENRSYALMTGVFTIALLVAAVLVGLWLNRDKHRDCTRTKSSPPSPSRA
jgi:phospholipid/cholesterol/gamma-HCH transport system ATP-binding protein